MKKRPEHYLLKAAFIIVAITLSDNLDAQFITNIWADGGKNNMSEGTYIKAGAIAEYKKGKNIIGVGGEYEITNNDGHRSPAFIFNYSRQFRIKTFTVNARPFLLYRHFSESLSELNYGLAFKSDYKKFIFSLGTNFRTYSLTPKAKDMYDIEDPGRIRENFNMMYSLSWYVFPFSHKWNAGITATNYDFFYINQETNPLFNLHIYYRPAKSWLIYATLWYKSAGALNLSVNTFGYFIRTGIKWQIEH